MTIRDTSLQLRGMVMGDLRIEGKSEVLLTGMVSGTVHLNGGKLMLRGIISKDLIHTGGSLQLSGLVGGRVLTQEEKA